MINLTRINGQLTVLDRNPNEQFKDFCFTCLCIYDNDGLCICTKYTKNSSGEYVKNHVPESLRNDGGSNGSV